jgi:signal peptidase I
MSDASQLAGRPRRWWVALLLNAFLPPAGYAYLGRRKAVIAVFAVTLIAAIGLTEWSVAYPPGLYAAGQPAILPVAWAISVLLGVHAAWLARRSVPKIGSRLLHAMVYVGLCLALFSISLVFRALWPHSVYSTASDSMSPTLIEGDLVLVNGARAICGGAKPKPGEIIVFRRGNSPVRYMHRVVAGPGQIVSLEAGRLSIGGKPVAVRQLETVAHGVAGPATIYRETLPNGATYLTYDLGPAGDLDNIAPVKVPPGAWYELGDNRDNAADSRVYGAVRSRDICGIATRVLYSKDKSRVGQKP